MTFIADENFPIDSVIQLRAAGFQIESIQESSPGLGDAEVLTRAVTSRSILAFDRDFGDLIFNRRLPAPPGIVYFRFDPLDPEEPSRIFRDLLKTLKFEDNLTVISRRNIRQRELPI